jgi:C1A family cysteine protease
MGLELEKEAKKNTKPDPVKEEKKHIPEPIPTPSLAPAPKPTKEDKRKERSNKNVESEEYRRFGDIRRRFNKEYSDAISAWNKDYQSVVSKWKEASKIYEQERKSLVSATYDFDELLSFVEEEASDLLNSPSINPLDDMQAGDFHVIPYSMSIDIRNQKRRGTCAAFAGIRAIETVLYQDSQMRSFDIDLSEQHFYWLSKPDCQKNACIAKNKSQGSLFDTGFILSKQVSTPLSALKQERFCAYQPYVNNNNLTFTPLNQCQTKGQFRVGEFNQYLRVEDIVSELSNNRPIAAGFKLTKSFQLTNGLVRARDPKNRVNAKGKHVGGHAILLIGYIKLPKKYWANEGNYCAIMANSWGSGYGVGGYACLTEKWMQENRFSLSKYPSRSILTSVNTVTYLTGGE